MGGVGMAPAAVTVTEAQAYVRIDTGEEEAIVAGLIRTATALCESFIGQALIARPFNEDVPASGCWQRLTAAPVQSISAAQGIASDGSAADLASSDYGVDVDSGGSGWVRLARDTGVTRLRVSGTVGMAESQSDVPEPIRQGVLRLVAHLFATRDGSGGEPPAAVTALWRPYRRLGLR
ncbi:hypothetical protein [Sphingomonas sp.]|uniref:head-tail connector protein n=1 Tax=Sphingomonas sp. TaxID=28214 RepID=UPI0025F7B5B6|nr:hypothetical protein [Sphingomonas sp.]MBV9529248.1 hypothetical protein [Sphingomonas sp.]